MPSDKVPISFRLRPEIARLLERLAAEMQLSKVAVVEQAIRQLAKREGVK